MSRVDRSPRLTPKAERELEERFALEREMRTLFDVIVAEWESDPMSVQCFDLRTVQRAKEINKRIKELTPEWDR